MNEAIDVLVMCKEKEVHTKSNHEPGDDDSLRTVRLGMIIRFFAHKFCLDGVAQRVCDRVSLIRTWPNITFTSQIGTQGIMQKICLPKKHTVVPAIMCIPAFMFRIRVVDLILELRMHRGDWLGGRMTRVRVLFSGFSSTKKATKSKNKGRKMRK